MSPVLGLSCPLPSLLNSNYFASVLCASLCPPSSVFCSLSFSSVLIRCPSRGILPLILEGRRIALRLFGRREESPNTKGRDAA
jgi:hypothetical protein